MGKDWNSIMFDNIGEKIKKVAKVTAWIGIVVSIIGGIVLFFWGLIELEYLWFLIFLAPITVVVGCIMAWLSVIMLYGFGEIIDRLVSIDKKTQKNNSSIPTLTNKKPSEKATYIENTVKKPVIGKEKQSIQEITKDSNQAADVSVQNKENDAEIDVICCNCKNDLSFMGYTEEDLKENPVCPFCNERISL